jgi:hypothetical protein
MVCAGEFSSSPRKPHKNFDFVTIGSKNPQKADSLGKNN